MLEYIKITSDEKINDFIKMAEKIWHEYFPFLLSDEQIDYMLEKFQSFDAIKEQQKDGYEYYFIRNNDKIVGYTVFSVKDDYLFLSKLYFTKECRGLGYGRKTLKYLSDRAAQAKLNKIQLTVNKYNENSIRAYEKWGFKKIDAQVFDIGGGYVMDDFIMQLEI